jgi:hypothetical protein
MAFWGCWIDNDWGLIEGGTLAVFLREEQMTHFNLLPQNNMNF